MQQIYSQLPNKYTRRSERMKRSKIFKEVNDQTTQLYDRVTRIETEIIDKITGLRKIKNKNNFLCEHLTLSSQCEEYDPKVDYYDLFWKTFLLNEIKRSRVEACNQECAMLVSSLQWLERKFNKYERLVSYRNGIGLPSGPHTDGQKFTCKMEGCGKTYESIGALDLHHKIKHQSDRQDSEKSSPIIRVKDNHKNNRPKY